MRCSASCLATKVRALGGGWAATFNSAAGLIRWPDAGGPLPLHAPQAALITSPPACCVPSTRPCRTKCTPPLPPSPPPPSHPGHTLADLEDELEKKNYQIRDRINIILRSKTVEDLQDPGGTEALQEELINELNQMLVSGEIKEVYFEEFIIQ